MRAVLPTLVFAHKYFFFFKKFDLDKIQLFDGKISGEGVKRASTTPVEIMCNTGAAQQKIGGHGPCGGANEIAAPWEVALGMDRRKLLQNGS